MASIRNFFKPGRDTLLEHPREYIIFVRCGFKLIVTLISNFMTKRRTFSIQPMPPKAAAGKNECLKIFIKASKITRLLVHGRWLLYVQKKSNLQVFNALFDLRRSTSLSRLIKTCTSFKQQFFRPNGSYYSKAHYIFRLRRQSKQTQRFVNLICPYIHPCFDSKIHRCKNNQSFCATRTPFELSGPFGTCILTLLTECGFAALGSPGRRPNFMRFTR